MASSVDIVNLALARLGDRATVASIDPPEASAQASLAARFYPIARDSLLESHDWNFATRRETLALVSDDGDAWAYAYAYPANAVKIISVLPEGGNDQTGAQFTIEVDADGNRMILTNTEVSTVRYTIVVTDTTKFTPLFIEALSWTLASSLAGPLLKGDAGAAEAKRCLQFAAVAAAKAAASDANQRHVPTEHTPDAIRARGYVSPFMSDGRVVY